MEIVERAFTSGEPAQTDGPASVGITKSKVNANLVMAMAAGLADSMVDKKPAHYHMHTVVDPEIKVAQTKLAKKQKKARIQAKNSRRKNR
jgi:hypothetical protein